MHRYQPSMHKQREQPEDRIGWRNTCNHAENQRQSFCPRKRTKRFSSSFPLFSSSLLLLPLLFSFSHFLFLYSLCILTSSSSSSSLSSRTLFPSSASPLSQAITLPAFSRSFTGPCSFFTTSQQRIPHIPLFPGSSPPAAALSSPIVTRPSSRRVISTIPASLHLPSEVLLRLPQDFHSKDAPMGAIQSFLAADLSQHRHHHHQQPQPHNQQQQPQMQHCQQTPEHNPPPYEPVEAYCKMLETLIQKRYQEALVYCSPSTSQPCRRIYRNWHPDDQQRQEKQLEQSKSRFLLSYPAEKYNLVREDDHSPVVNPFFNLSGLFFCATGSPLESELDETGAGAGGPVATSPYGKTRFQVEFGQMQRQLFPEFKLYFADHYRVVGDWYIQLIVVPSWNVRLEEQCVQQGMIELDLASNPFFYRAVDGQYWVSNSAKLWMELFIGCDTIPTTDLGEIVESRLHEKVRKTRNLMTEQEERERHARVLENIARDLIQLAAGLRDGNGPMDNELVELTYGLSMARTQLGVMQSREPAPVLSNGAHKEESREE